MDKKIIDGQQQAAILRSKVKAEVEEIVLSHNVRPHLAVIWVGTNPASELYTKRKVRFAKEVGISASLHHFPSDIMDATLSSLLHDLNHDRAVHGILIQLPLPAHIDKQAMLNHIDPNKDVDGFHPLNVGRLYSHERSFIPCTAQGILLLARHVYPDLTGKKVVVIGRSAIVGRPTAEVMLQHNCTVTIAHSHSQDLAAEASRADIIVAAAGVPKLVKSSWVKPGACVIDVGIHRLDDNTICGDVDFHDVIEKVGHISPVPGGVGPMTIACLLENTVQATRIQLGLEK